MRLIPAPPYHARIMFLAPAATPVAVVQRLNREVVAAAKEPDFVQRLQSFGYTMYKLGSLQATSDALRVERERWTRIVRELGIEPQ